MRHLPQQHLVALAIIGVSSCVAGATAFGRLIAVTGPSDSTYKADGDMCVLLQPGCSPEAVKTPGNACYGRVTSIRCSDTECQMNASRCLPQDWYYSGGGSASSATYGNHPAAGDDDVCIRQVFECRNGSTDPNCFKRLWSKEVKCEEDICDAGGCVPKDVFLSTTPLAPWDLGPLPGPFPRTETMCTVRTSACPPTDMTCLSDISIQQVRCDDASCMMGPSSACTYTNVQVDENDRIIPSTGTMQSSKSSKSSKSFSSARSSARQTEGGTHEQTGATGNPGSGSRNDSGEGNLPFQVDFPAFQTPPAEDNSGSGHAEQRRVLGCFLRDGTWSQTRGSDCDPDQLKYIELQNRPTLTPPAAPSGTSPIFNQEQEAEVRVKIEERFFSDTQREDQRSSLLRSADDAIARLALIVEQQMLPFEASLQISATIDWLKQTQVKFGAGEQSLDDIQSEAEELRRRLSSAQALIASSLEQSGIPAKRNPDSLLTKTDRIFSAVPTAFSIMQQAQIVIPPESLTLFMDAQARYERIKPECQADAEKCLQLTEVVDVLEPMIRLMKDSIAAAGQPDVEMQINTIFQR